MDIIAQNDENVSTKLYYLKDRIFENKKKLSLNNPKSNNQDQKTVVNQRFEIHKKSVKFIENVKSVSNNKKGARRGRVTDFTYKSMERMKYTLEDCLESLNYCLVLTYPKNFPTDGLKVRRDRHLFLEWLKRQGITSYFWLQEFQLRGAPHLHMMLSKPVDKMRCQWAWYKIVGSGDYYHLSNGIYFDVVQNKNKLGNYFIAHATKQGQKELPDNYINSGRWWGCSTNFSCKPDRIIQVNHSSSITADAFKNPLVNEYRNKMNEWSKIKREKQENGNIIKLPLNENDQSQSEWNDFGYGFNAWGCAEKIDKLLCEGDNLACNLGKYFVEIVENNGGDKE